jgi:hypothetical protein
LKKIETALMVKSGAGGKLIHEKNIFFYHIKIEEKFEKCLKLGHFTVLEKYFKPKNYAP